MQLNPLPIERDNQIVRLHHKLSKTCRQGSIVVKDHFTDLTKSGVTKMPVGNENYEISSVKNIGGSPPLLCICC
jgi:hypothetical protein